MRNRNTNTHISRRLSSLPSVSEYLRGAAGIIAELCWTSRCVLCDTPGPPLCPKCRKALPYLDRWTCCETCGAPWGAAICTSCNTFILRQSGRTSLPFLECRSAILYRGSGKRLVKAYKDRGERSVAKPMALLMAQCLEPSWISRNQAKDTNGEPASFPIGNEARSLTADRSCNLAICPIPASKAALRKRGFDHMDLVGQELSRITGLTMVRALEPPASKDQRTLSRTQRALNMASTMRVKESMREGLPEAVLVVDDVLTTGSTLCAACDVLAEAGVKRLYGLTFARVP